MPMPYIVTARTHPPGCAGCDYAERDAASLLTATMTEATTTNGEHVVTVAPARLVNTETVDYDAWAAAETASSVVAITADLFPTVNEVGAKAISMFLADPHWWRQHYPLELVSIVERWIAAHPFPADETPR